MAKKKILRLYQQSREGKSLLLREGTYDTLTGVIDPGDGEWLETLIVGDRDVTLDFEFEDGSESSGSANRVELSGTSALVNASLERA